VATGFVIGCDGSGCSNAALDMAIELARELDERLGVVFGYEPGGYGEEHRAHREAVKVIAERVTAEGVERAAAAGVDAEAVLIAERPTEALMEAARDRDARAIVVGTYGESPLKGAILGSTPHKLLQVSDVPVLVVPR
jgi:nucleotide-binding universal stress UspA family protein